MKTISIIVEFENATLKGLEELTDFVAVLKREILAAHGIARFELLCAYPGSDALAELPQVRTTLENIQHELADVMAVRLIELPNRRYYELKNEAARQATGEIIIFLDSDIIIQPGWLDKLLAPFDDPAVQISAGVTGFLPEDFLSRTFALIWFFPLPNDPPERLQKRALPANNVAFRRSWFLNNPYPYNEGFKVSCTIHARNVARQGVKVARPHAVGYHHFWSDGLSFLVWRALVTGRDADRKISSDPQASRWRRTRAALSEWRTRLISKPRRIIRHRGKVSLPWYQVPAAIGVAWAFYTVAMVAQLGLALGLSRSRVEYLPARFHAH